MRALRCPLGLLLLLVCAIGCRRQETTGGAAGAQPVAPGASAAAAASASPLPVPDLGYNAREGKAVYRHYCLTCHGEEGRGDGFNAYNLDPKPRDLGDETFQAARSDEDLVTTIRSGGSFSGFSSAMPPWGRTLSERRIRNVVEYLRTLRQTKP